MNILILNYEYPPLGGGAANATYHLLREMAEFDDLRLTLLTSSTGATTIVRPYDNVTIRFLDIGKRGSLHYQSNQELLRYSWRALREAKRLLRGEPFDVVHAFFGIPGGVIADRLGLPYLVSLRGSDVPGYSRRYRVADALLFGRLSRRVWRHSCAVVANSSGLRTLAQRTAPNQQIDVVPNGVDTDFFSPMVAASTNDSEPSNGSVFRMNETTAKPLRLLYVGRLIPRKGLPVLLDAVGGLEHVSLTIVGTGPEEAMLRQTTIEKSIPVSFQGEVAHEALPEIYRSHDAFVLPSRNEGMSNTLLEAMASGLPVVVTNVGGTAELVNENGFVVAVDDVQGLRSAIRRLRDNISARATMAGESRRVALDYSWSAVAAAYADYYRLCGVG